MLAKFGAAAAAALVVGLLSFSSAANAANVMKECGDDWKAFKAANPTSAETWQQFLPDCRAKKQAAAAPAPAAATPAAITPVATPAPAATVAPTKLAPAKKTAPAATGAGEFASEAEAKAHCPADVVVWVNTKSHKYHYAGHRSYGTTKQGAYACEADAKANGNVAAKGEKSP